MKQFKLSKCVLMCSLILVANYTVTSGGEVIPGEMVSVAAGSFDMGDPWAEGNDDELPVHTVTLSAYQIGKYEVTNQEYADALNWANGQGYLTTASRVTASGVTAEAYGVQLLGLDLDLEDAHCQITWNGSQFVVDTRDGHSMADHPVVYVTWYGAVAYCNWVSEREGLTPCYNTSTWTCNFANNGYHLPTEAQWERAAAWNGSAHLRYGNGSDSISCGTVNYHDGTDYCNPLGLSGKPYTSPVGYYTGVTSPAGCFDMSGNVWEWCNDWGKRVYTSSLVTDPEGRPATGTYRLVRGGTWAPTDYYCRSAFRSLFSPVCPYYRLGFRVARNPSTADFAATPTSGTAPLTVQFTDLSTPGSAAITTWLWDFGDGAKGFSTAFPSPSHRYTSAGSYTVSLMVTTPDGNDLETKTDYINVSTQETGEDEGEGEGEIIPGEMVPVAAGTFSMGDPWAEGDTAELPVHTVTLSAYQIGKYEVTNQEYADALNWANGQGYLTTASSVTADAYGVQMLDVDSSYCQITWNGSQFVVDTREGHSMADHPVVVVTWYGAVAYCNWLSEREGLTPCYNTSTWACNFANNGYHLPTDAQWERAAAWNGSAHLRYGNGSDSISFGTVNYRNGVPYCNPLGLYCKPFTSPVGYYTGVTSPAGCFDMSGNVWEWCNDWSQRVYTSSLVTDPEGPATGTDRLVRGGSWDSFYHYTCRSAYRGYFRPNYTAHGKGGFRVARTPFARTPFARTPSTADFAATPTSGTAPLTVQFTDLSTPGSAAITTWLWDFGDGAKGTSTAFPSPSHRYTSAGSYTVSLMVTTPDGNDLETKTDYINVSTQETGEVEGEGEGEIIPGEMVPVAAGSFDMGDPWAEGNTAQLPVHTVTLSAYQIGKYEVTNQEYADALNWANGHGYLTTASVVTADAYGVQLLNVDSSYCQITWTGSQFVVDTRDLHSMADHPVVDVTWYGAVAYCNWVSESEGLTPCYNTSTWACNFANNGYHLPTEAQWERAAAWNGSAHLRYGNGFDRIGIGGTVNYHNGRSYCNPLGLSGEPYTSPVGYYTGVTSPAGCFDMSGNVWEWCNDWGMRVYTSSLVTDPEGPATGTYRVVRGGGWNDGEYHCRSAYRGRNFLPDFAILLVGFRVARTPYDANGGAGSRTGTITVTAAGATGSPETVNVVQAVTGSTEETIMLPGDVPLVMVWIPAGSFMMGRYAGEQDSSGTEDPQHSVTVPGFWMGKYELTKAQWTAVMGTSPWTGHSNVPDYPNSPAIYVSWNDGQAFITALNTYSGKTFRLPSEAEWEYACRAGTTTRFYWGDDPSYAVGNDYAWWENYDAGVLKHAHIAYIVGEKLENTFGLFDMSGNVLEWCQDWCHFSYTGAPTDGSAWESPTGSSSRVVRGGGWGFKCSCCRSAGRYFGNPSHSFINFGFRLAR